MNAKLAAALRAAALSMALTVPGAATALADPPGYYFQESWQPTQPQPHAPITRGAEQPRCAG